MRLFGVYFWKEKAGVICPTECWVAVHSCWMHTGSSFFDVAWNVITEWKNDRHLVG